MIRTKERVAVYGEVFTAEREVNAMLDQVGNETVRIESRFLEPACGDGNFLSPILEKKLEVVSKKYSKSQLEFERYSVIAIGSIYGIDILNDNVVLCRERLFQVFDRFYTSLYNEKTKDNLRDVIRFLLQKNIIWGDALSLKTVSNDPKPIVFSEWSPVNGSLVKRRDFKFEELFPDSEANVTLFKQAHISDLGTTAFIPSPVKEFPLTHFLSLHEDKD
jgi:hypothetical protein